MAYVPVERRSLPPVLSARAGRGSMVGPAIAAVAIVLVAVAVAKSPLYGVAAIIAVAAGLALVRRPVLSAYLIIAVAPACAGLQRGLIFPGLRVSEVAIAGLGSLILLGVPRLRTARWTGVEWLLLVYAAGTAVLGGLDLALRHAPLSSEDLGTLLGPVQFLILVRALVLTLRTERMRIRAVNVLIGAGVVVALIALAQFANLGPTRSILTSVTGSSLFEGSLGEGAGRVTGPFNIWHELAGFLMPSVLLSLALLTQPQSPTMRRRYAVALILTAGALIASAAIGVLVATFLGAIYITWQRGIIHVVAAIAVPAIVVVAVVFGGTIGGRSQQQLAQSSSTYQIPLAPQTISYRYAIFEEQSVPALAGHWTSGYGPDLPPQLALGNFPYAETTYVTLLLRGGVILLIVFLGLLFATGRAARALQREARSDFDWSLATVALIMTVAYAVLQLIESYLLDSGPPHAYWAVIGIMLAGAAASRSTSLPERWDRG